MLQKPLTGFPLTAADWWLNTPLLQGLPSPLCSRGSVALCTASFRQEKKSSSAAILETLSPFPWGGIFVWPGITCHLHYFRRKSHTSLHFWLYSTAGIHIVHRRRSNAHIWLFFFSFFWLLTVFKSTIFCIHWILMFGPPHFYRGPLSVLISILLSLWLTMTNTLSVVAQSGADKWVCSAASHWEIHHSKATHLESATSMAHGAVAHGTLTLRTVNTHTHTCSLTAAEFNTFTVVLALPSQASYTFLWVFIHQCTVPTHAHLHAHMHILAQIPLMKQHWGVGNSYHHGNRRRTAYSTQYTQRVRRSPVLIIECKPHARTHVHTYTNTFMNTHTQTSLFVRTFIL